jgi:putative ABC transport system permease protein
VVLSHALWRARFASDSKIVGQTVRILGEPFEVIGVAAASFDGVSDGPRGTRLWIPLNARPSSTVPLTLPPRDLRELTVFGRLAPSVTTAMAAAEVSAIAASLDAAFPRRTPATPFGPSERPWRVKPLAAVTDADTFPRRFGLTIIALTALVLVVACTNLGNLVLARGTTRQHEVAVRSALGASPWRLVREQLAESVLIAIGGAAASYIVFQILCVLMAADFHIAHPIEDAGRCRFSRR